MKNVKYANRLKRTMVIIGCHTRWDVATKATVVEYILTNGIEKNGDENKVLKVLNRLHRKLAKLRRVVEHAPDATVDAETLRSTLQSVQEELSEASIKSE